MSFVSFGEILLEPIRNGLTKPKAVRGNGVKMIAMGEIFTCSRIGNIKMDRVPVTDKEKNNCAIKEGDLLFARQSLVLEGAGKCSIVTSVTEDTVFESHLIRARIDSQKANPYFYYYFFNSYMGRESIKTIVEQVAAAGIRGSDLIRLAVPYPSFNVQNRVVALLDSVDRKIELNNEINDNLYQQLDAIYRITYPYLPSDELPAGWNCVPLGTLCDSISIKHSFDKEKLIFLNTGDVENGNFLHSKYSPVKEMPGQAKKSIKTNDILYSEIRPINRHFAFVNFQADDYVVSTKLMVIRSREIDSRRLYHFLTTQDVINELQIEAESRSGTFPQIRFENVQRLPIIIAPTDIELQFTQILKDYYNMIDSNIRENQYLVTLRDSILPKLMSGEIDVTSIEI